jgi:hypothetical protein
MQADLNNLCICCVVKCNEMCVLFAAEIGAFCHSHAMAQLC